MLTLLLCAAMIVAWRWPQTPVGQALWRLMVDWPARQLAKLTFGKMLPKLASGRVLLVVLILLAIAAAIALARTEGAILLAQGFPEGIAVFATFDIAAYLDVIALALVLGATVRLRALYVALRVWITRTALGRVAGRRRGRDARSRSRRRIGHRPPPSNDDEPAWSTLDLAYG